MGINSCGFNDAKDQIVSIKSSAGEVVPLLQAVEITENVEHWLHNLSVAMEETLTQMLIDCVKECDYTRFPSQILCLAEMVSFTSRVEVAINNQTLPDLATELRTQLDHYTSTDASDDHLLQLKIQALVLDLIHNIEVVDQLIKTKISALTEWMWQKQLRFYLDKQGVCVIRMCDAQFKYSYEYQGNASKLVHTPLTDKCYLVLTQGMHLGYGGNPYGPAGTGKTESVKALGQAFGRQVLVFNCDEGIDFQSMGRIFTGLVKSGAWGCFDEFNRLKEDQLSAVSQQIQVIQAALKRGDATADLLGKTIEVNSNAAIFVTMNPASKEYGGRSKLPHNLKQLFRAVAMSVPDLTLIAETILYSEGFTHAKIVGKKVVEVYQLARQLLTPQKHYDWGLRALKTILKHGGQLIHKEKKAGNKPDMKLESTLMIGALKINTISKLTYADSLRFLGLINDVFPGCGTEDIAYKELEMAIRASVAEMKLESIDSQVKKILQLHEALHQRMGVVVVGPSGCGKTVMLNVLHSALKKLGKTVVRHVMNPKALEREKLLGHMDMDTREWFDGVLTDSARQVYREPPENHSWVICDGDIDPEWIESLNSVLDDNHLLTMPNGERIKFADNVNFVFESHDLQHASPATISRMGMIFLSEEDIDVRALITSWLSKQSEAVRSNLGSWMDDFFYKALSWVTDSSREASVVVKTTKVGIVTTALSHLRGVESRGEFILGLCRGMGSNLLLPARVELYQDIFEAAGERLPDPKNPLNCGWNRQSGSFMAYLTEDIKLDPSSLSVRAPPIIETVSVQSNKDMIKPWMETSQPFVVVGPEGSGKTLLLTNSFSELRNTSVATIHCSAQTKATHVQQKLMEVCQTFSTVKGRVLRPSGDRLILFLKDLNLPKPDEYDTIQLIAFLQQLITYNGFHNDSLEWIGIEKVHIVASMNPATTVGRNQLSTRFTAIVNILYMDYPPKDELVAVFSTFMQAVMSSTRLVDESWKQMEKLRKLTAAMVSVYEKVSKKFTVDEQRHYLFNPRDVTEWSLGLMRYDLSTQQLLDVWAYEGFRLFSDRLISEEAKGKLRGLITTLLKNHFKHDVDLGDCYYSSLTSGGEGGSAELGPVLDRIPTSNFRELVKEGLHTYEREFKTLRMLLFRQVLDHIAFEDRVLSRPGGSLLLIGESGVGRRSSVTLVCHLNNILMWSPNCGLNYSLRAFRNDLKELLKQVGVEGKKAVLYIEDHHLAEDAILEDINSLLAAGAVPGLFTPQELDATLTPLKEEFASDGRFKTVGDFFVSRVHQNLHICLGLDPTHPKFAVRCESNPAIYTRCTILWMGGWGKEGLKYVPQQRLEPVLSQLDERNGLTPDQLVEQVIYIHKSNDEGERAGICCPNKFVAFLDTYLALFSRNQTELSQKRKHLQGGLQKLGEAADMVDVLSKNAEESKARVSEKQEEADQALVQITKRMSVASERKSEVEQIQTKLGAEEQKLSGRKEQIEAELKEVQPLLDEAKQAVGGIKKDNLNEIRAFRQPPETIRIVLAGVLTLLGSDDLAWQSMKGFLAKPSVKEEIINFDAKGVTKGIRTKVKALMKKNPDCFVYAKVAKVNVAAAPLATWVSASMRYAEVVESIAPLQREFDEANGKLDSARERLSQCQADLKVIDDDVKVLKTKFGKMTSEAEALKVKLQKTTQILESAQSLLGKLDGEKNRWDRQVKGLVSSLQALPSHALVAAGFVTYLGAFPEDIRTTALADWKQRCDITNFQFMSFMATESDFLQWKAEGLPSDSLSMQNGLLITNAVQTPFVIDPNVQAAKWLQKNLENENVELVRQQDPKFVTSLELSVRFGKTLVIQECEGVLPMLYPLLRKDLCRQGPRWVINIGDKTMDYSDKFRLFLVTRDPNPDLPSAASAVLTEVNFTVTRSGLEGQLLGVTLNYEKPELEQQKSQLLAEEDGLKIKLANLEKKLLQELAASEGNILENKSLIDSLDLTKTESNKISESLQTSKSVQADLDRQREVYRDIARTGSILFFLIAELKAVSHMYNFALPSFIRLFTENLADPQSASDRIKSLIINLKLKVFRYVSRSLFKADRVMFGMHMIHSIQPDKFGSSEWEWLTGELVQAANNSNVRLPAWATEDRAADYRSFSQAFPSLVRQLRLEDDSQWRNWSQNARAELDFPPDANISAFQKLLLTKVFRPDRLQSAIQVYVCDTIGIKSVSPDPLNFQVLVHETHALQPILFIATAGADPTQELEDFANKEVGENAFAQLALGSGQTDLALEMVKTAARDGTWVCLKNCHLVTTWLVELEKTIKASNPAASFRLWLTTEPHDNFPAILLQQSLKVTYESPPGIKQNLLRTYEVWDSAYLSQGGVIRAQLLFILAWFHAILQERRTYIPQGFTKFYEFSFADLRSGADIVSAMCARLAVGGQDVPKQDIPWTWVMGLMTFAVYGGRIDNDHDLRVVTTYLRHYFNVDVLSDPNGAVAARKLIPGVELPASTNRADYMRLIEGLPNQNLPSTFGLPENVEATVQRTESVYVLGQLRKLAVSSSLSSKFNRSVWQGALGPLLKVWESMTSDNGSELLAKPARLSRDEVSLSPVESFVVLEVWKCFELVSLVNASLSGLANVLNGNGLLNSMLLSDGTVLLEGKVPWRWAKHWYGPEEAGAWLKQLLRQRAALNRWMNAVEAQNLLSSTLSLGDLFRPKTFLNALRQETARATGVAIDSLKLTCSWDKTLLPKTAAVQVSVTGLWLQGCSFSDQVLGTLSPDSPTVCSVPAVTLSYMRDDDTEPYGAGGGSSLAVPVYICSSREEFVCDLKVPCKGNTRRWVVAGVALFLCNY